MIFDNNCILDQADRFISSANGVFKGVSREVETIIQVKVQSLINKMSLVRSEEFEAVKNTLLKVCEENASLRQRLEQLEKYMSVESTVKKKNTKNAE
ncbi:hypothetical protein B488_12430 [Liberibacter crescens BT-1]|uniref:Accessory factor UbiK family protein n=1 Tax=Liberibacter crescens (strain BT-1) TaxID=1215343 RepID=L0EWK5_LIBCB|nr:accessory factor UbiK family protein [Liberibacter crescens]AGA65235.1 hypothetical protein B488_12430 [Liberibacter crescens BT-1]AMC13178.1 hypothetical protein RL73_06280 [Liberibacter crescens]